MPAQPAALLQPLRARPARARPRGRSCSRQQRSAQPPAPTPAGSSSARPPGTPPHQQASFTTKDTLYICASTTSTRDCDCANKLGYSLAACADVWCGFWRTSSRWSSRVRSRASCATSPVSTASAAVRVLTASSWVPAASAPTDNSLKTLGSPAEHPPGMRIGRGASQVGSGGSPLGPAARRRPARKRRRCSAKASLHGDAGKSCQCHPPHKTQRQDAGLSEYVMEPALANAQARPLPHMNNLWTPGLGSGFVLRLGSELSIAHRCACAPRCARRPAMAASAAATPSAAPHAACSTSASARSAAAALAVASSATLSRCVCLRGLQQECRLNK